MIAKVMAVGPDRATRDRRACATRSTRSTSAASRRRCRSTGRCCAIRRSSPATDLSTDWVAERWDPGGRRGHAALRRRRGPRRRGSRRPRLATRLSVRKDSDPGTPVASRRSRGGDRPVAAMTASAGVRVSVAPETRIPAIEPVDRRSGAERPRRRRPVAVGRRRSARRTATAVQRVEVVVDGWRFVLEVEDADRAELRDRADRDRASRRPGVVRRSRSVPSSRGASSAVAVAAGDTVDGRPAAPGRGGDEDAERAARPAGRDRPAGRASAGLDGRDRRAAGRPRMSDARPDRPIGEGRDPGRDRWRETLRAKAAPGRPGAARPVRDLVRHRGPRPVHAGRHRRPRRGPRPGPARRVPVHPRRPGRRCTGAASGRCASTPGFATAEETNQRFRYLLDQGQTGLSVAFDLPTQMGYDSDAPAAEGEVGRVGVPISSPGRHGRPARRPAARARSRPR